MAFHQPTRQPYQRLVRADASESEPPVTAAAAPHIRRGSDESQTWVLFSPSNDAATTTSYLSSAQESHPTPGRSVLSDLGSLNTIARSDQNSAPQNSAVPSHALTESAIEDDAELDSLDSHLADFRSIPSPYGQQDVSHATPVLPGHDGLGSFRLDAPGTGPELQEQLYAFERFNPKRVKRRRASMDLAQLEVEPEAAQEAERNRRIEAWRLEQSQFLLEKIQKETRQRRQSEASSQKFGSRISTADEHVTMSAMDEAAHDIKFDGDDWHDQDAAGTYAQKGGLWTRITRKVIRDLMGIDDQLLSILFGEALPVDDGDLSSTPKASVTPHNPTTTTTPGPHDAESYDDSTWQLRVLERVARELGLLVHRMSTHPGAFSTYARVQQAPIPYAGLPVIPEAADAGEASARMSDAARPSMPEFQPTIAHHVQPVAIPGTESLGSPAETLQSILGETSSSGPAFSQQEWEQDLDVRLIFRYLRSRFTSSRSSSTPFTTGTSHLATSSTQDAAAKAARVRQHHPLVTHAHSHPHQRSRPAERRPFKATGPSSPVALRHPSGSCASQSTRRSARRSSVSSRHSSRHYWDIGGSIGTGSMIASAGPMGSWGEV